MQNRVYRTIGQMMTIIAQGGESPALLSPAVVDYLNVTPNDVTENERREALKKV